MAFKMKNKEVMKLAKEAGNNRISPMKVDDGKKKKTKDDELMDLVSPASLDTMEYKVTPGFVDFLKRNTDASSSEIIDLIKSTDKRLKKEKKGE